MSAFRRTGHPLLDVLRQTLFPLLFSLLLSILLLFFGLDLQVAHELLRVKLGEVFGSSKLFESA